MSMVFRLHLNPRPGTPGIVVLPSGGFRRAVSEITRWDEYAPTPLRDLPRQAAGACVEIVRIKDEAGRFGLGSFKALGGPYAVAKLVGAERARRGADTPITVTCATDGNHGRAVAWGARRVGVACVIFVHATVSAARVAAIAHLGAEVRCVPGTYDDAVREAAHAAADHRWHLVADTSWPGYTGIPVDVMQGYRLMPDEALTQWRDAPPTHVFIQAGVGGLAAAVATQVRARLAAPARLIVVEPERAACLLASAVAGAPTPVGGDLDTIMAGLACGEPSLLAWQELERAASAFMTIPDCAAVDAMRRLAADGIVSGESGAAGLAALLLAAADSDAREKLALTRASRVLLFSTEGATDPELYDRLARSPA